MLDLTTTRSGKIRSEEGPKEAVHDGPTGTADGGAWSGGTGHQRRGGSWVSYEMPRSSSGKRDWPSGSLEEANLAGTGRLALLFTDGEKSKCGQLRAAQEEWWARGARGHECALTWQLSRGREAQRWAGGGEHLGQKQWRGRVLRWGKIIEWGGDVNINTSDTSTPKHNQISSSITQASVHQLNNQVFSFLASYSS
jgi:hypothetical protein